MNNFKCRLCQYQGNTEVSLLTHMESHSASQNLIKCPFKNCDYSTTVHARLRLHQAHQHKCGDKPLKCSKCDRKFANEKNLQRHMLTHGEKKFVCTFPGCESRFHLKQYLKNHQNIHEVNQDQDRTKPFKCPRPGCDHKTSTALALRIHERKHDGRTPLQCPVPNCDFRTRHPGSISDHIKSHDPERPRPFKCTFRGCSYAAPTKSRLVAHKIIHSSSVDQFACSTCGKKFTVKASLTRHEKSHVDDRPFACKFPGCGCRFRLRQHMQRHEETKHNENRERKFPCDYPKCQFKAHTKFQWKAHWLTHYPDLQRNFVCSSPGCGYSTNVPRNLRIHQTTHDPEHPKPYKCSFPGCKYAAKFEIWLKKHHKVHEPNREKKVLCGIAHCTAKFFTAEQLRCHQESVHAPGKNLGCSYSGCEFVTTARAYLMRHENAHYFPKEKPVKPKPIIETKSFACNFPNCKFCTTTEERLKRHQRIRHLKDPKLLSKCPLCHRMVTALANHITAVHTKEKAFKCSACDFSSAVRGYVKNHYNKKHSIFYNINVHDDSRLQTFAVVTVKRLNLQYF